MSFVAILLAGIFCGFVDSCLVMGYGVTATSVLMTFGVAPTTPAPDPSEGGRGVEQDKPETDSPHQKEPQNRSDAA